MYELFHNFITLNHFDTDQQELNKCIKIKVRYES